jgi:hypothetical protein
MSIQELELPPASEDEGCRLIPEDRENHAFPYETESFHRNWWTHLACRFDIPVKGKDLLIHRKSIAKGLIKLQEVRIAGWNNAWNQSLTATRIQELEELNQTTQWDYLRVTLSEAHRSESLLEQLKTQGYLVLETPAPCQYSIDMSNGLEGYLKGLSHNSRKSLKKKTRVGQALNPALIETNEFHEIDAFFEELFKHHISYWDSKTGYSYFNEPAERHFIVNWAKTLHQEGKLVLDRLVMGDETVNISMGIRTEQAFYWLLTVNTGLHQDYAPGIIGLYMRLQKCSEQGVTQFHMGAGDYFYKIQSANQIMNCSDLIIANPESLQGKLYYHWMNRKQAKPKA